MRFLCLLARRGAGEQQHQVRMLRAARSRLSDHSPRSRRLRGGRRYWSEVVSVPLVGLGHPECLQTQLAGGDLRQVFLPLP